MKITGYTRIGFPLLFCCLGGSLVRRLQDSWLRSLLLANRRKIGNLLKTTEYFSNTGLLSEKKHAENLKYLNYVKLNASIKIPFSVLCWISMILLSQNPQLSFFSLYRPHLWNSLVREFSISSCFQRKKLKWVYWN